MEKMGKIFLQFFLNNRNPGQNLQILIFFKLFDSRMTKKIP